MIILHCIKKEIYENRFDEYLRDSIRRDGFIHCSDIKYFWRVLHHFGQDEHIILLLNTDKIESEIKWKDLDGVGRTYPHIYGLFDKDAVESIFKLERDAERSWVKPIELAVVKDE